MTKPMKDEMEILNPTPVMITIGRDEEAREIKLRPLVMKHYSKLFALVGGAVSALSSIMQGQQRTDFMVALAEVRENPIMIVNQLGPIQRFLGEPLMDFLASVLRVEKEWLEDNLEPEQFAKVLYTIYLQNDVEKLTGNFSPLVSLVQKRHPQMLEHLKQPMQFPGEESTPKPSEN